MQQQWWRKIRRAFSKIGDVATSLCADAGMTDKQDSDGLNAEQIKTA